MNLNGQDFEEFEYLSSTRLWELRIPIAESQNVNFFREVETELKPMVLSKFVAAVEHGMKNCLERGFVKTVDTREAEVVQLRTVMKRYYPAKAAAAAAGAGIQSRTVLSGLRQPV